MLLLLGECDFVIVTFDFEVLLFVKVEERLLNLKSLLNKGDLLNMGSLLDVGGLLNVELLFNVGGLLYLGELLNMGELKGLLGLFILGGGELWNLGSEYSKAPS